MKVETVKKMTNLSELQKPIYFDNHAWFIPASGMEDTIM